jgi:acyl-coenzyme A thioesterase PaaI-like protein
VERRAIQDQLAIENHCFGCGPANPDGLRIKSYLEGEESVCVYTPLPAHMAGPRQFLNGGIIGVLIDCHSICTAIAHATLAEGRALDSAPPIWCVTGSMQIDYLRPTPIDGPVTLRARIESVDGKRTLVTSSLEADGKERARGRVVAVRVPSSWRADGHAS